MTDLNLSQIRSEYSGKPLTREAVNADPTAQFAEWMREAITANAMEPTAMVLSTVSEEGRPSSRVVLLKDVSERGLVFFTNYASRKGRQIGANADVALLFFWPELERQVRIEGSVEKVSKQESAEYFSTRPYESQLGAWASRQSTVIADRDVVMEKFLDLLQQHPEGEVPLPEWWGGYVVTPRLFEFWQGRESRLHDRIQYVRSAESWKIHCLAP